jgi:hypothetical protein
VLSAIQAADLELKPLKTGRWRNNDATGKENAHPSNRTRMLSPPGAQRMFENNNETAERNHLLRLLAKAILKLEDAAATNSKDSRSLGPVRAELVQVVQAVRDHTDGSISHVMLTLHRLGDVLDAMSGPVIREARTHLTSSVSLVLGLLRRE